jgi:pteridine reductase
MAEFPLALVTGAAHRVGRILALALARQGYAILLHYHASAEKASATAEEIRALGVPVHLLQADLATDEGLAGLFSSMDTQLSAPGRSLKVLVNSAAVMTRGEVRSLSPADWDATFALNLRAPFLLAQGAAERMVEGSMIVNVTDAGAGKSWMGFPAYTVSKAALESLTRLQARAYAPRIRVNAIAPGLVLPSSQIPAEEWDRLVKRLPLGRPASAQEIAGALEYLLANKSVTGQTIVVDGGYSLI